MNQKDFSGEFYMRAVQTSHLHYSVYCKIFAFDFSPFVYYNSFVMSEKDKLFKTIRWLLIFWFLIVPLTIFAIAGTFVFIDDQNYKNHGTNYQAHQ